MIQPLGYSQTSMELDGGWLLKGNPEADSAASRLNVTKERLACFVKAVMSSIKASSRMLVRFEYKLVSTACSEHISSFLVQCMKLYTHYMYCLSEQFELGALDIPFGKVAVAYTAVAATLKPARLVWNEKM